MKVPKEAKGDLVVKTAKKRAVSKTVPKPAHTASTVSLHKKVAPKKREPNFTMSELTGRVSKNFVQKKATPAAVVAPQRVPESKPHAHGNFVAVTQVAGMGLVVFGMCFAFVFGAGIVQPYSQKAELAAISSTTNQGTLSTTTALSCSDGMVLLNSDCTSTKPRVTFTIPGNHAELQGLVPVSVSVDLAQRVKLSVYSKETHTLMTLGLMTKVTEGAFTYNWPTRTFHDGTYFLQVVVENQFGAYEVADTAEPLTLLNFPPLITSADSTTTPSTAPTISSSSTGSSTTVLAAPTMTSNVTESASEFRFAITAESAQSVKMFARLQPDGVLTTLGYAYRDTDTLWRYRWLPGTMPAGKYTVGANVYRTNNTSAEAQLVVTKLAPVATLATTSTATSSMTVKPLVPDPVVSATVKPVGPVFGRAEFTVRVPGATAVNVYALGSNTLTRNYIGKAFNADTSIWTLSFDSAAMPDGEYTLITVVTNSYGTYESRPLHFGVKNRTEPILTPEQTAKIDTLRAVAASVPETSSTPTASNTDSRPLATSTLAFIIKTTDAAIADELIKLAAALRAGDTIRVAAIKAGIESLKQQVIASAVGLRSSADIIDQVTAHVAEVLARTEANVATIDKIIAERTGEKASTDSDQDGVSDFDEVTIYKTNPFGADTDNDGFLDGAEILNGFDPLNAKSQTLVAYESPKEAGVEQNDLLAVTSITTAVPIETPDETRGVATSSPTAVISGTAPANSFVTVYIFSTPIVVTIKTDADGGWNYHFDKELENGTHEVYVGVTDNAGKIVAKSAPFTFIKTAEAYSGQKEITDAVATPVPPVAHNLLSTTMLYVLGGLFIFTIGFVLLLIGTRFDTRRRIVENIVA